MSVTTADKRISTRVVLVDVLYACTAYSLRRLPLILWATMLLCHVLSPSAEPTENVHN